MKILYVALKETLPGSHGGAVHVLEVARQLARRGHQLTVVVQQRTRQPARETQDGFEIVRLAARSNFLLFQLEPAVRALIAEFKPDVVMERYYNFSGAGMHAARRANLPALLEVNAPMMDPPGTKKYLADQFLFGLMTRMARTQASIAKRIVTPLAATVPFPEARDKVREIPWGANVELFDRAGLDEKEIGDWSRKLNPSNQHVVAFLGSFRAWHGVREFVQVAAEIARTRDDILFLMIGAGDLLEELRPQVERANLQEQIVLTGAVKYDQVPYYLALADVGVAPFNTAAHPPLRVGFYWSPLKVHEYMAMGLPVVTIDVAGLNQIVRHEQEGLLYPEGDLSALHAAIVRLVDDPALARKLGAAGRARVVQSFSWQKHAELLEGVLNECMV
ncbi:MAG: glycosyltransferase family 4 protein [Chloroflexi bacterium]|nr:glycosyltransferase family 4 protein [Chloroflexota bacterium]